MTRPALLVPEVVQTSLMDCGPACLKALLEGFGIHVSYGRLREACQTDVDGTSIDTLEGLAQSLGLDAQQTMLPVDHLFLPELEPLPAVIVTHLPGGDTHFVVAWRRHGPLLQIMDPAIGRRWTRCSRFLEDEVHVHETQIPSARWIEWITSESSLAAFRRRMGLLGVDSGADRLLSRALEPARWQPIAALDAAIRQTQSLVRIGAIARGAEAQRLLESLYARAVEQPPAAGTAVPATYWVARPGEVSADGEEQIVIKGAVLIGVLGKRNAAAEPTEETRPPPLSPELALALTEPPARPGRDLWRLLRSDGLVLPSVLVFALLLSAGGVLLESVLLRSFLGLGVDLSLVRQRVAAAGIFAVLAGSLLLIDFWIALAARAIGRRFEGRFRVAFLEKIPGLADRYLHSRPISDMAARSHSIHEVRNLAALVGDLIRLVAEVCFITITLCWLDPPSAPYALALVAGAFVVALLFMPGITELDLRVRNHLGGLSRFYLDSLMGLVAIRAHSAERAVRREHESSLVEWARARFTLQRRITVLEALQSFAGFGIAAVLILAYLSRVPQGSGVLLFAYWALLLPTLGQEIVLLLRQYPTQRNSVLRLLEPLGAISTPSESASEQTLTRTPPASGVSIAMEALSVRAAGHTILEDISVKITASEHVCIVGPSGAGKSSFVGLLLGWHRPADGELRVDGEPHRDGWLEHIRAHTAWLDPSVQLWNRSLYENLRYGNSDAQGIGTIVDDAELADLLESLPEGLQSYLGESGGLVSGGEGQRVRLGRAMLRHGARLVILDEPFRGLDRTRRHHLLGRARRLFSQSTLLCITHDIEEAQAFDRVLVIENGRLVEDGAPASLAQQSTSRYAALLNRERHVRERLWAGAGWRKLRLEGGVFVEEETV